MFDRCLRKIYFLVVDSAVSEEGSSLMCSVGDYKMKRVVCG
jgi:hypothetical protein